MAVVAGSKGIFFSLFCVPHRRKKTIMSAASIFLYIVVHNIHASLDPIPSKLFNWRIYFFFSLRWGVSEILIRKRKKKKMKYMY